MPKDIVAKILFVIKATNTAINAEYNLKFSNIKYWLFSNIDKPLKIIGVNTAKGMYLNVFFILRGNSLGIIPDNGINLIKKVRYQHFPK